MKAETLATGLYFGEGPRWHDGRLWFSDFNDHAVKTLDRDGKVETEFEVPNQPSGLGWLPDGRMLIVSMLDRKLLRREGGQLVEHADLSAIATWHCNDMVVDAAGRAYVGNFGFDLEGLARGVERRNASLARVDPDGAVSVAATELEFPNGTVITPDGRTMIIGESMGARLTAFDVAADGSLSNRRVWADSSPRLPDGICLDQAGHIWVANPRAGEAFLVAEGGEVLEVVETSQNCYACMLGGDDGKTLYCLTAAASGAAAGQSRTGKVEVARAPSAHAGLP
jgi:sugar lactone lactonase YvrE